MPLQSTRYNWGELLKGRNYNNYSTIQLSSNKAKVPSIWAKGFMLDNCDCVILKPDNTQKIGRNGEHSYICNRMSFTRPFCLAQCSFHRPPVLMLFHLERRGMHVHYAVGINCKKEVTTENQGAGIKYKGYGVYG